MSSVHDSNEFWCFSRTTCSAEKSPIQSRNSFDHCSMGDWILVGCPPHGHCLCHIHGRLYQVLRNPYSFLKPEVRFWMVEYDVTSTSQMYLFFRLPKNLHFTETLRRPVRSLQQRVSPFWTFRNLNSKFVVKGNWISLDF